MDYVLSLSYGKDSLACLGAIEKLGWPLTRIVHAEIWATDSIQADLPPMIEFKKKADQIILKRYGIKVEHVHATKNGEKVTFEKIFYSKRMKSRSGNTLHKMYGWPFQKGPWCNDRLKINALDKIAPKSIHYLGIAADEPERFHNLKEGKLLPLLNAGWDEQTCKQWCIENDLLSPIYSSSARGGCWFCHNQGIDQLRILFNDYPELWALMLKWDKDSPVSFHADGHTVKDFDKRFKVEKMYPDIAKRKWNWDYIHIV